MTSTMPGTRPSRIAYPPPVPVGFTDPGGRTPVEHALRVQHSVHTQYSAWRSAHSKDIAPDVLKANAGMFAVSDPALALAPVLDAVKADADTANGKVDDLIGGTKVGDDVASQLAATRYWNRTQRTLDAISDTSKLVAAARTLLAGADDQAVPVLAEELSSYLATRNVPTGWLSDALAGKIPGLADAQSDKILKSRQLAILQANHDNLTRAMTKDTAPAPLLDPFKADATAYGD
jgi:hypothetical protein